MSSAIHDEARLAEAERLGRAAYDRNVRPVLRPEDDNKYAAVAYDTDDFEIDADDCAAIDRLLERRPGARVWLMQVGQKYTYRFGPRRVTVRPLAEPSGA